MSVACNWVGNVSSKITNFSAINMVANNQASLIKVLKELYLVASRCWGQLTYQG